MAKKNSIKDKQYFKRQVARKVGKAINNYKLIEKGELIVVGISGGKDSLALTDILAGRLKHAKDKYSLAAVHVGFKEVPYKIDVSYLEGFCKERNVAFYHKELSKPGLLEESDKPVCFLCSWNRRKVLLDTANALGAKKLALGHHMDDAIETLLMSMSFQGAICSMPVSLQMFKGKMQIIRPMIYLKNKEVQEYANMQGFKKLVKECPYQDSTKRDEIRKVINGLEKLYPDVRHNLFNSMKNVKEGYLP